jgi:poly-gamma-glutamate system protein
MKLNELEDYRLRQKKLILKSRLIIGFLAAAMAALWYWCGSGVSLQEQQMMNSVRRAQEYLYGLRTKSGSEFDPANDPYRTGFIGLEWSPLSTTLGALPAKRTVCDPRWSVVVRRWMESLKLQSGDCVAVYSSSSFPGMAFNVLRALESLRLEPLLIVSLGASTWGANDPLFPWPLIEKALRSAGYLRTKAMFYTLGGGREIGGGMPDEATSVLVKAAEVNDVPIVKKASLDEMVQWKMDLLEQHHAKALISIGGSEANMGPGNDILRLRPGLHLSGEAGSGVIGRALRAGYPVVHLLNIKGLCAETGVPYDAPPSTVFHGGRAKWGLLAGVILFTVALAVYKRWTF